MNPSQTTPPNLQPQALRLAKPLALLLVALLLFASCAAPVAAPAAEAAEAAPLTIANPDALVDTAWVLENLETPGVRFLAIHGKPEEYDAGHLPGAALLLLGSLANPDDPTKGQVLTQQAFADLFSSLGINNDDTVVLHDGNNNLLAARAYWVLKYYQHADVRIYNGGLKRWAADGNSLTTDAVPPAPATTYVAGDANDAVRATGDYVLARLEDGDTVLCDTRGAEEYAGTDVRSARGGHIPGARNVDWVQAVNDSDGTFKDPATLADLYSRAGFPREKEIITYCQTGVRGAHTWFVLSELLGYPTVRNYDGSWEEWGNDGGKPLEQ